MFPDHQGYSVTTFDVVNEARSWIGVPFVHQGRARQGVDCAGLVIMVAKALGLSEFDTTGYERVPNGDELVQLCNQNMQRRQIGDAREQGNVVVMRFTGMPQHLAILASYPSNAQKWSIIHALQSTGRVVETILSESMSRRILMEYRIPGVE